MGEVAPYSVHVLENNNEKTLFYGRNEEVFKVFNGLTTFFKSPKVQKLHYHSHCGFDFYFLIVFGVLVIAMASFNAWHFFFKQPPEPETPQIVNK